MKLKPYMRGIGIGMIVTAAVLHFTFAKAGSGTMTDEEIKARAKELGMIENTVLKSGDTETAYNTGDDEVIERDTTGHNSSAGVSGNNATASGNSTTVSGNGTTVSGNHIGTTSGNNILTPDEEEAMADSGEDGKPVLGTPLNPEDYADDGDVEPEDGSVYKTDGHNNDDTVEYKTITVANGDSSYAVAKKVAAAGIVESAAELDEYLCANKYDKSLVTGNHRIPVDASYQEIAKILTSKAD